MDPVVWEAEAAQESRRANIYGNEAHRPLNEVEQHVVGTHHLTAINVDDLLIQQVALEEDLVLPLAEAGDVDAFGCKARAARVESLHGAPWEIDASSPGTHHKAGHRWMARPNRNDQVVNRTDRVSAPVAHGSSNESREMEHRALRCWLPPESAGSPAVYAGQPSARYPAMRTEG